MLAPGWVRGKTTPAESGVTLRSALDHVDHICQIAGSARHCGIGTDLDGAFGTEQVPADLETIADITQFQSLLLERGYTEEDVRGIMHGNFIGLLLQAWAPGLVSSLATSAA
jgi:membrane dipeptidase